MRFKHWSFLNDIPAHREDNLLNRLSNLNETVDSLRWSLYDIGQFTVGKEFSELEKQLLASMYKDVLSRFTKINDILKECKDEFS